MTKLRVWNGEVNLGYLSGFHVIKGSYEREAGGTEKDTVRSRGQSDEGSWGDACGQPPEKGRKSILPQSLQGEWSPAKSFLPSDLQNSKRINLFCFKLFGFCWYCSVTKSCLALCNLMDCAPSDSSSMGFPRLENCHLLLQGIFLTRDQTHISCIAGRFFTTEPPPGKPLQAAGFVIMCYSSSRKQLKNVPGKLQFLTSWPIYLMTPNPGRWKVLSPLMPGP